MKLSQHNLAWPLSVLLLSLLIIGMLLLNPAVPTAAPLLQRCDEDGSGYYPPCSTATRTRTRTPQTETSTNTRTPTDTGESDTPSNQSNATSTPTSTRTRTPTPGAADEAEEDLDQSTSTSQASNEESTSTGTPTLPPLPEGDVLTCVPGVPLRVEGQTTPKTALLLYFDGRAVGGATSNAQGRYSIQLVVGDEPGGDYPLEVQVRGTRDVVDTWVCRVPGASNTPTPTP